MVNRPYVNFALKVPTEHLFNQYGKNALVFSKYINKILGNLYIRLKGANNFSGMNFNRQGITYLAIEIFTV